MKAVGVWIFCFSLHDRFTVMNKSQKCPMWLVRMVVSHPLAIPPSFGWLFRQSVTVLLCFQPIGLPRKSWAWDHRQHRCRTLRSTNERSHILMFIFKSEGNISLQPLNSLSKLINTTYVQIHNNPMPVAFRAAEKAQEIIPLSLNICPNTGIFMKCQISSSAQPVLSHHSLQREK